MHVRHLAGQAHGGHTFHFLMNHFLMNHGDLAQRLFLRIGQAWDNPGCRKSDFTPSRALLQPNLKGRGGDCTRCRIPLNSYDIVLRFGAAVLGSARELLPVRLNSQLGPHHDSCIDPYARPTRGPVLHACRDSLESSFWIFPRHFHHGHYQASWLRHRFTPPKPIGSNRRKVHVWQYAVVFPHFLFRFRARPRTVLLRKQPGEFIGEFKAAATRNLEPRSRALNSLSLLILTSHYRSRPTRFTL